MRCSATWWGESGDAEQRRQVVTVLRAAYPASERRICLACAFPRATQRYRSRLPACEELRARLHTLAALKRRWGYRRLHWLLQRQGWAVNHKLAQWVYREAGLLVRKRVSVARTRRVPPDAAERAVVDRLRARCAGRWADVLGVDRGR